jgi:DNA polymerase-1
MKYRWGVFDLESNGFLYDTTNIWCIVVKDLHSGEVFKYDPSSIHAGLCKLQKFKFLIGHNICNFDIPLIWRFYPNWKYKDQIRDTLCMSKLFNPERFGGHSLESYGEQFKRAKPPHEDFSRYTPEMLHRCTEDVEINCMTYEYLVRKYTKDWSWKESLQLEQDFALDQGLQELAGVDIDLELAYKLIEDIDKEVGELDPILLERMPKRVLQKGVTVKKVFLKSGGYTKQVSDWFEEDL